MNMHHTLENIKYVNVLARKPLEGHRHIFYIIEMELTKRVAEQLNIKVTGDRFQIPAFGNIVIKFLVS
jgi:hypothetical protein